LISSLPKAKVPIIRFIEFWRHPQISNQYIYPSFAIDEVRVKHVHTTLGTEQEYFLIDRGLYSLRPDLKITGRTLLGGLPPRHQQLENHYFGKIPTRILAAMSECEMELYKLGVPVKTRHNEVAPAQFELAPIFEEAMIAVDHNLITMDVLHRIAHRHKLKVLFHEKPFKGVNGSGKHCNWSMSTDTGENLLEPTAHPETNYRFLLFLVSILKALADHGGLLRAGIASASNEHRLGAHEAPPGIISAFMGDHLDDVLNSIEEDRPLKTFGSSEFHSVRVGGTVLDLKVATLPNISRDLTDRNRTSPFAFTGNKFEFRAVGSKQSVSFPMTLLNSAVAASLQTVTADLKKQMGNKKYASDEDMRVVIKKYIKETKKVRFEGDNYSESWVQEAKKRGLPNINNCPDAFAQLQEKSNADMLYNLGVFAPSELHSRYHILMEKYAKDIQIEAETLRTMLVQHVLPCAFNYRSELAGGANALKAAGSDNTPELNALRELSPIVANLQTAVGKLEEALNKFNEIEDIVQLARDAHDSLAICMEIARSYADSLERLIANKHWPFPKYAELFLNI
jgi:glutamine synthetase